MTQQSPQVITFTLGDRLRKARERAGLDQKELAGRIAASRGTVSNYENGHHGPRGPKIMVLRAWAHECGIELRDLVEGADNSQGAGRDTHRHLPVSAQLAAA